MTTTHIPAHRVEAAERALRRAAATLTAPAEFYGEADQLLTEQQLDDILEVLEHHRTRYHRHRQPGLPGQPKETTSA